MAVHEANLHNGLHIGDVNLDLAVETAAPVGGVVRIVDFQVLADLPEDGPDVAVVGLHIGCGQLLGVWPEGEVDFRERAGLNGDGEALVAYELGGEHLCFGGTGFQAVVAVHIRGNADGGAVKVNAHKGEGFSGLCVLDHTTYTRGSLGSRNDGYQQEEPYGQKTTHPSKIRRFC